MAFFKTYLNNPLFVPKVLQKIIFFYRLSTEKDPNMTRALIAMGQVLFSKKSLDDAADYFERAISKVMTKKTQEQYSNVKH